MRTRTWAAVELTGERLRLWLMPDGGAVVPPIVAPIGGDPVTTIRTILKPHLVPGETTTVIASGWPDVRPDRIPCRPPVPGSGQNLDPQIALYRLPGLVQDRPADLVDSAVCIAGYLARSPQADGVVCIPGTPTVWAHLSAGEIVSFRSFLTVDLLAALAPPPIVAPALAMPVFTAAVQHAMSRPAGLAGDLSSIRARLSLHMLAPDDGRAEMAGLLIGVELAAARPWWLGQTVSVVGSDWLADGYAAALAVQGVSPQRADPDDLLLEGFRAAFQTI